MIWALSVGIATADDFLTNVNIISVIILVIFFQENTVFFRTDTLLWSNALTIRDLASYNGLKEIFVSDTHSSLLHVKFGTWMQQVILAKILSDLSCKELKDKLFKGIL